MSFWRELLFFQSWGSLSFSGHLDSMIFLQRFGELSTSLSSPLKSAIVEIDYIQMRYCKTFLCSGKWHEVITCGLTGMKMWPSYMLDYTLMAPQACGERKDTGLTLLASTGKRSRKSNSWSSIRPCLSKIWREEPRAVCNDLCRIDLFPVISTITENCKKPLASE